MFYQQMFPQLTYRMMVVPSTPAATSPLLQSISFALTKSIEAYQQVLVNKKASEQQMKAILGNKSSIKATNQEALTLCKSEQNSKNTQKNCQALLQNVDTIKKSTTLGSSFCPDDSQGYSDEVENNLANIPNFQLTSVKLSKIKEDLMGRRVDCWKKERPKRKRERLAYNWY